MIEIPSVHLDYPDIIYAKGIPTKKAREDTGRWDLMRAKFSMRGPETDSVSWKLIVAPKVKDTSILPLRQNFEIQLRLTGICGQGNALVLPNTSENTMCEVLREYLENIQGKKNLLSPGY
jgi:hypothetical protein